MLVKSTVKLYMQRIIRLLQSGAGLVTLSRIVAMLCIFALVYVGGEQPTGVYATNASAIGLLAFAIGLGISANYSYFVGKSLWNHGDVAAARRLSTLFIGLIGGGGWWLSSDLLHHYLFHGAVSLKAVQLMSVCVPILIHQTHTLGGLQAYKLLGRYALINCLSQVLPILLSLIGFHLFENNDFVLYGYLLGSLMVCAVSCGALTAIPGSFQLSLSISKFLQAVRYGILGYMGALASLANYRLDLLVIAALAGPSTAGSYAVLSRIAESLRIVPIAMQIALTPKAASMAVVDAARETLRVMRIIRHVTMLLAPTAYILGVLSLWALGIDIEWLGLAIILLGTAYTAYTSTIVGFNVAIGRPELNTIAATAGLVVTLITMPGLVYYFQILGGCVSSALAYTAMSLLLQRMFAVRHTSHLH